MTDKTMNAVSVKCAKHALVEHMTIVNGIASTHIESYEISDLISDLLHYAESRGFNTLDVAMLGMKAFAEESEKGLLWDL